MTIPTVALLAAPGPVAKIKGMTPITVDAEVIKIGLNRTLHDSMIASFNLSPSVLNWFANSTIKIPFLAARPIRTISAI